MKALVNSYAALLRGAGVDKKEPMRRATEKPPLRFADAPALLGIKQQARPDKNVTGPIAVSVVAEREQVVPDSRNRSGRLPSKTGQVPPAAGWVGQATDTLVQPARRNVTKAGSAPMPSRQVSGEEPAPAADPMAPVPLGNLPGSPGWPAGRTLSLKEPSSLAGALAQTARHTDGDPKGVHWNKAQAGAAKPTLVEIAPGNPERYQKDSDGNRGPMPAAAIPTMGRKGQAAATNRAVEPGHEGSVPVTTGRRLYLSPGQHGDIYPDQALPKTPALGRQPAAENSPQIQRDLQGRPSESHPRVGPKYDGPSAGQNPRMQLIPPGAKEMRPADLREGTGPLADLSVAPLGQPPGSMPQVSAQMVTGDGPEAGLAESPTRAVAEQILDTVRASVMQGDRQIVIRLQPPELGTVIVRLREQDQHLEGVVEADNSDTRLEIERALPEVIGSLREAGVPIRRFDVTTGAPPESDLGRGSSPQDGASGQPHTGQGRDSLPSSSVFHAAGDTDAPAHSDAAPSMEPPINRAGDRIDLLL